jgi:hypothetical protein
MRPLFGDHEGAINKAFRKIQLAAIFQVLGQRLQNPFERSVVHPALEAPVAGLVRQVPSGHVGPLGSRA